MAVQRLRLSQNRLDGLLYCLQLLLVEILASGEPGEDAHALHVIAPVLGGEEGTGDVRFLQHGGDVNLTGHVR